MKLRSITLATILTLGVAASTVAAQERQWLAGEHHAHTHWSVKWDKSTDPWSPIKGGDSQHTYLDNAQAAKKYGLSWLVNTDHGGPEHSKLLDQHAYPELLEARKAVPEVHQFFGIELDVPDGEHATVMMPINAAERDVLVQFQRDYSIREYRKLTRKRNNVEHMQKGIEFLAQQDEKPIIIKNHPSRQATGLNEWARVTPEKLMTWHQTDPDVFIGMVGSPGHQAARGARGAYYKFGTFRGADQMTAVVGGVWDHILGNGMRFWITSSADSHKHASVGGRDFWPGEYNKTYVYARNEPADIMDGLRRGRSFMVFGDLISGLNADLSAGTTNNKANNNASLGETLLVGADEEMLTLQLELKLSNSQNANGDIPVLSRIDVITGAVDPAIANEPNANSTTKVIQRIDQSQWQVKDNTIALTINIPREHQNGYLRLRGTSTDTLEPKKQQGNQYPWQDLWFFSNPIFWQTSH
ncbi:hypothetical protein C9J03_16385 [Photobacterium gaetbulicola]|uniref:Phosphoesterase n=1 Tax=Photobacterium gaetbulicola Gung47 TaxID=658445 RepID=A0A0C5WJC9_9GAMM|nr:hypothetical protein [Photobacterium gaetbulicola]AJR05234.1 hypothetical protein H744_1c0208 [Photobacterium gaetbulicola Gung47]PSU06066.1 hypothetical protein C9J03_16385 [Photobacterium gaetbulicola]